MIVVTGAGGQLGRLIALALSERIAPDRVRLGSREPGKLADLAEKGFATAPADFDRPETLERAFAGAEAVLIVSGDAPNELRIRQHRAAIDAAKRVGAGRVLYTSFTNPGPASLFPFAAIHADSEAHLKASGVPFTILRNNLYAENLAGALANAKSTGTLALPGARGKVAFIRRADLAAATAGALIGSDHAGRIYELTGPEALDLHEIAEVASAAWGRPVSAAEMPPETFAGILRGYGLPPFVVEAIVALREAVRAGEYAAVSPDASRLAGRPVMSIRDYVAALR